MRAKDSHPGVNKSYFVCLGPGTAFTLTSLQGKVKREKSFIVLYYFVSNFLVVQTLSVYEEIIVLNILTCVCVRVLMYSCVLLQFLDSHHGCTI